MELDKRPALGWFAAAPPPILPPKADAPQPRRKCRKKLMVFILAGIVLHLTDSPNALPDSEHCPGQLNGFWVDFHSQPAVRFRA
jgi:hypothetical protein